MISIETQGHNAEGIGDLSEAIALAKIQGISIASGAIAMEALWPFASLGDAVSVGLADDLPGVSHISQNTNFIVAALDPDETMPVIIDLLEAVETRVTEAAGEDLPNWTPTDSLFGVRMVAMSDGTVFRDHTDDYEGLVLAVQIAINGQKTMRVNLDNRWEEEPVGAGDIVFFAGDSFGNAPRIEHGFKFNGLGAVSFTMGQDPNYTISGRLPMFEENPQYVP